MLIITAFFYSVQLFKPRQRVVFHDDASDADVDDFVTVCGKIDAAIQGPYFCGRFLISMVFIGRCGVVSELPPCT